MSERIDAFEEALQIVRGLLTTDGFTFEGRHFSVTDATLQPRCVQQPTPPIWVGASGERRMLPIVARHADVWHCSGPPSVLAAKSRVLDELCERSDRDPASLRRAASLSLEGGTDSVRRAIDAFTDAGFSYLVCGWPSQGRDRIEAFAASVFTD